MRISYFGGEGSFAHEAAQKAYPNARAFLPAATIEAVLETLYCGRADCGIIPIENTSGGMITDSIDALISPDFVRSRNRIREELTLTVHLSLMSNVPLKQIRTVYSHAVPLNFLDRWLRRRLPQARCITTVSTTEGALLAARDPYGAAIANAAAAKIYGLKIIRVPLPQQPNQTCFYAIAGKPLFRDSPQRAAICFGLPNRPGSLVKLLAVLGDQKINMTRITSRPLLKRDGQFRPHEYVFWVDFEGDPGTSRVQLALKEARRTASFLDVVGAYRRRKVG